MRRSAHVAAPLLASAALALLTACKRPEPQRCVDENNKVVDDSLCANQPGDAEGQRRLQEQQAQQQHGTGGNLLVPLLLYHYYFDGSPGGIGSVVSGGGRTPLSGHSYATGTSRGGFGRSFSSGGAHGGGGEGGGE